MSVTMICPNLKCGRTVVAADAARGRIVRCAHCQSLFLVPREPPRVPDSVSAGTEEKPVDESKRRNRR